MALRDRMAYLRRELRELLRFAGKIQSALTLGSSKDFPERQRCLAELRGLGHGLRAIEEHCHADERAVESTLHHFAGRAARRRLESEHAGIVHALMEFREELRFATADRTESLRGPGMALLGLLRAHIAYEQDLLRNIDKSGAGRTKRRRPHTRAKGTPEKQVPHRESSGIPYTMEPHPEL
jgi:hypothetical protein